MAGKHWEMRILLYVIWGLDPTQSRFLSGLKMLCTVRFSSNIEDFYLLHGIAIGGFSRFLRFCI